MFRDRTLIWVLEYIFGTVLVLPVFPAAVHNRSGWTDAHVWALELFVACLGVVLISCASSMRQRMILSKRIEKLAEQIKTM